MRNEALLLLAVLATSACTDEPHVEFSMDDDTTFADAEVEYASDDEFAMLTENGAVKLGLTRERVYFEVSEAVREHVDEQIAEDMGESDSRIGRSIGNAVRRGVRSAMSIDIDFDIDEIRDVEYRAGELRFEFENDHERSLDHVQIDDEPIGRSFAAEDAQALVAAFRRVKAGESVRGAGAPGGPDEGAEGPGDGTAAPAGSSDDSADGASF